MLNSIKNPVYLFFLSKSREKRENRKQQRRIHQRVFEKGFS